MSQPAVRTAVIPLRASRQLTAAAFFRKCRARSVNDPQADIPRNSIRNHSPQLASSAGKKPAPAPIIQSRFFSTSNPAQATVVKQNPRADDDGNDMTIEISEKAAKRLHQITQAPQKANSLASPTAPDSHLRVTVTSGGCHGFQYLMSLEPKNKIDKDEDTIFVSEDDTSGGHAEVVMDSASLELLKGSTVDYTTELIGSQFKITGNPRAKSSCGCGTSFDIE